MTTGLPLTAARRPRVHGAARTAIAFAAPLLLYLATMAPTVYNLDSAEFSTAAYTGGIVRATGYPLYLLVGSLWSRLPIGDVGYRMNLLSAVCGALTIALTDRVLQRLGIGGWPALGALGLLATTRYFWALSLIAEVYTPHTALMAGILLLLLRWSERPSVGRLVAATFVVGLSAGHHMATVLLAPACLLFVLRRQPAVLRAPASLIGAAAALAAGLAVYLYLPWLYSRAPDFNYAGFFNAGGRFQAVDLTTWEGFWWLVSGRAFADQMLAYGPVQLLSEAAHFGRELWRAFAGIGIGPGLLGLFVLWRRRRVEAEALLLMFAVSAGFYVGYAVGDKDTMFLPAYLVWALWLAVGYQWLLDWVAAAPTPSYLSSAASKKLLLRLVMVAAVVFSLSLNLPLVDLSRDASARQRGEMVLTAVEADALVIGRWETVPVVEYLQLVEGRRPDVRAINRFLIRHGDLETLVRREIDRRPVYLDEPPEGLFPDLTGRRRGPVYRVERRVTPPLVAPGAPPVEPTEAAPDRLRDV